MMEFYLAVKKNKFRKFAKKKKKRMNLENVK